MLKMLVVPEKRVNPLGTQLREMREAVGLSQQEVADHLGVVYITYYRWEKGKTEPTFSQLCRLARLFGKTLNDFTCPEDGSDSSL
jgi:transcriptional regulator with XRE-family HTH domain